jgi:hypothetical protein
MFRGVRLIAPEGALYNRNKRSRIKKGWSNRRKWGKHEGTRTNAELVERSRSVARGLLKNMARLRKNQPGPRRSIVPTHSTKIAKASGLEARPITH